MSRVLLLLTGSTREGSTNTAALATVAQVAAEVATVRRYDGLAELPAFNPDLDREPFPAPVVTLRDACAAADAVLVCTPEYAGALPGSFKNLLDWTIGGSGLYEKPVGWINVTGYGPTMGADAHHSLAKVLAYAGAVDRPGTRIDYPLRRDQVDGDGLVRADGFGAAARSVVRALLAVPS